MADIIERDNKFWIGDFGPFSSYETAEIIQKDIENNKIDFDENGYQETLKKIGAQIGLDASRNML